ncbi:ribonuclease E [Allocatelliglobosispora scoriae]|uniref:Ribonuclease E n=1 Tax=Allocatelliglobosispora scoriae TaxID=643052 RepID=A0A841BSL6_9ACTN|nr:Rne/Rng family ribonuclease [Allocatelliglobosispora scoriae]MBB5869801.1 ribonuclease E [Allocatelliglobosispora scoriae]
MLENEPAEAAENAVTADSTAPPAESPDEAEAPVTRRRTTRRRVVETEEGEPAAPRRRRRTKTDVVDADDVAPVDPVHPEAAVDTDDQQPELDAEEEDEAEAVTAEEPVVEEPVEEPRGRRRAVPPVVLFMAPELPSAEQTAAEEPLSRRRRRGTTQIEPVAPAVEEAPEAEADETAEEAPERTSRRRRRGRAAAEPVEAEATEAESEQPEASDSDDDELDEHGRRRRRRGRRGRGRGRGGEDDIDAVESAEPGEDGEEPAEGDGEDEDGDEPLTRRRRRRRRKGSAEGGAEAAEDDGVHTVVKIREGRKASDEVQGVTGSTRLEAKRQRRRDGREQRRTRPPILTESEFLARREAVDRVMVVRQKGDRTQIGVLEDGVLVEHYVTRSSATTMVGNVYLGKVQNVLPSMEAAFVDLGRGRNAVLYAGEVNWDAAGLEGRSRSIEQALKGGDSVLVQVTKDPIGHKGARLSSHIALSGRHLVYVPNGTASGISRKLSDVERKRLRDILKKMVPEGAGVIVRTAAEGASEDELERDVLRLQAQWDEIQTKSTQGGAPALLYGEPDLIVRVVRDLFNEDFKELVIQGTDAYETVEGYLRHVSPDLVERVKRYTGVADIFATYRVDEQILKGLDRKVYLPSGGHLVIDRTEAMTVVDVNTGKYTGAGGNLEETVTRNNLEAAEEIVRQLRLRDLGGIVVIDFIDMVLESNRELVLRRLTECLGRDRTKHQVTEITSLGLVQMTRKRIGAGLLEAFSETCEHCKGRGVIIHTEPVAEKKSNGPVVEKVKEIVATGPRHDDDPAGEDDEDGPDGPEDETAEGDEDGERAGRRRGRRGGARRRTRP